MCTSALKWDSKCTGKFLHFQACDLLACGHCSSESKIEDATIEVKTPYHDRNDWRKEIVEKLKKGENLSFEESKILFSELMDGKYEESSIIEILEAFIRKGETKDELAGGIYVLRDKANRVKSDQNTIDTCGTGGDGMNTLNISTASALLLASMGVKVAKHGNKAVSSKCGSGDVLEALNIKINL